ncbi:MAG: HTH-type transcriptional regulator CysB [Gammaproteobacteria bacterium]|jgi:LysR family cys regulon transcriptional activator
MTLRQLRYLTKIVRHRLNVTAASASLYTSQSGVSKQIRLLEQELGVEIFERSGKHFTRVTPAGETIIKMANRALIEIEGIREAAREVGDPNTGSLSIATTHTQARYALPPVIHRFIRRYPRVILHIHQGNPAQILEMTADATVDLAILTEPLSYADKLVMMPCYRWHRAVVTPCDHPLREEESLTLEAVAEYPLLTYVFGFTGHSQLDMAFRSRGLTPNVVFTATDADVVKTYVRIGLGIGIIAKMAYDARTDADLCVLDARHLFGSSVTKIGFRRGLVLRRYMLDFIELFAPHLSQSVVERVAAIKTRGGIESLFAEFNIPGD